PTPGCHCEAGGAGRSNLVTPPRRITRPRETLCRLYEIASSRFALLALAAVVYPPPAPAFRSAGRTSQPAAVIADTKRSDFANPRLSLRGRRSRPKQSRNADATPPRGLGAAYPRPRETLCPRCEIASSRF